MTSLVPTQFVIISTLIQSCHFQALLDCIQEEWGKGTGINLLTMRCLWSCIRERYLVLVITHAFPVRDAFMQGFKRFRFH